MAFQQAPSLRKLEGGYADPKAQRTDAIGRAGFRADQEKQNIALVPPGQKGGMPEARSEEAFIPNLLDAARKYKIPAQQATHKSVLDRVRKLGIVPQKMSKTLGTSDPVEQAYLIIKNKNVGGTRGF